MSGKKKRGATRPSALAAAAGRARAPLAHRRVLPTVSGAAASGVGASGGGGAAGGGCASSSAAAWTTRSASILIESVWSVP